MGTTPCCCCRAHGKHSPCWTHAWHAACRCARSANPHWSTNGATPAWTVASPLSTWRAINKATLLPVVLAVFQDQLVAIDDSYVSVCVGDETYRVSPIEAMTILKYHPVVMQGLLAPPRVGVRAAYRMRLCRWWPPTPCPEPEAARMVLAETVRPLHDCRAPHWYAREVFQLKRETNYRRMLAQRLQELEALLMLYQLRNGQPAPLNLTVDDLRVSRLDMLRHESTRDTA